MESAAPLPVIIPLIMAALIVVLEKTPAKHRLLDLLAIGVALAVFALDLFLLHASLQRTLVYWFGGWTPVHGFTVGIAFVIDPAGAGLASFAAFLTVMGLLFSWHYFKIIGTFYHTLMLLFLASMEGFCLTGDLFNMFVFFELMGVVAYALTGYKIEDTGPLEGALNFAVMNSIGAFLVLMGIGILYARTGALNLALIGSSVALHGADTTVLVAFMLLATGFLVKGAIVPFHFWLPDAHAVAPTPASVLFSGVMVELGLYAVARIYWAAFSDSAPTDLLRTLFLSMGIATAVVGASLAFLQRHMKRLLAYSTVSHAGIMLAGIALLDRSALAGTLLYVIGHGCVKGALFIGTGIVLYHCGSVDEETLRGKCGRAAPVVPLLYLVCGLALAGLPPFAGSAGESAIGSAAASYGWSFVSPLFTGCAALTGAAVLRSGGSVFYGLGSADFLSASAPSTGDSELPEVLGKEKRTPATMWVPLLLLVLCALAAGVVPGASRLAGAAAWHLSDTAGYRAAVLRTGTIRPIPPQGTISPEFATGIAGASLAAILAAAALFGIPCAAPLKKGAQRVLMPVARLLRRIHSGYIGDYMTWFMIGAAILLSLAVARVNPPFAAACRDAIIAVAPQCEKAMLLHEVVTTSKELSRTASRLAKIALLSGCIARFAPEEVAAGISYLSGMLRQGRIGVGFARVFAARVPPAHLPTLTLLEVDSVFSRVAATVGSGSAARRAEILQALLRRATGEEQDFLARLVVGELRQGALEGIMAEAVAKAADVPPALLRRAAMFAGDLATVAAAALREGRGGLARFDITLFTPVSPMLAQPAADLADALGRLGKASFEWKLDGARIQLHKEGEEIRIYSRNLNEVTAAVPELVESARRFPPRSLILDGEVLVLHRDGSPYPFQTTMRRFGRKLETEGAQKLHPLSPFFFDCLYLDGESLIDRPEEERFSLLREALPGEVVIPRLVTGELGEAERFLSDLLERGHEGVMAKALDSPYEAGRRGAGWLKVKPVQTLDLVVLAAEWGHGRRSGFLSNLHLGARDPAGGFVMLGKTFKGMTDAMLAWQTKHLLELEDYRDSWTVYVRPELLVEVAFSDIQASPRYPGGFALRFARVKRYRPDKSPLEADTVGTVRELYEEQAKGGTREGRG
ncbi:ATP-dependent DNA ligase [Geomonas sp. RF6]|uniref:ATP-dependent DNA ligase n=1 Tax=Geomonas sp. RF6 TaxID=2897342 RepID=UPI001E3A68B8|nr:ATP-dependent DNA ligase [Geomonas sp. RF6]UFS72124.1 ATP-dependent DNA ligase [Geomonas sp. RF6]